MAILLALNSPELEVIGITTCCGNVPANIGAENALKTLQMCSSLNIPVYIGEEAPLKRKLVTAQDTHGEDGIGENFYQKVVGAKAKNGAVDFIINTLHNHEKVSIIALAPLTNIAKALIKDKKAFENLDEFVSMGGAFRIHGNCSPVAEFNYWVDPHGADYVYKNLSKKIHMVGLDVTRKIVLTPNIIEFINRLDKKMAKYITEILDFILISIGQECVFIDRSICKGLSYVEVVEDGIAMGQSIVDSFNFYKKNPNAIVLNEVDEKKFMYMFLKRLFKGYEDIIDSVEGVI
ncbi:inosine-uridine preferring nucleoside hydrolase family protein [Clostridioides difficile DA00165]|nr:inosine-uridine preferring nucleoside hydrolase family protein [Clostridioides difficile DA00165]